VPRRSTPDALSLALGTRIKQLREEAGLTMEKLAYESEVGSKGHLSSVEKGLVRPTAHTLKALADGLGVRLADMVSFPDENDREKLFDLTRNLSGASMKILLRRVEGDLSRAPVLRAAEGQASYRPRRRPDR
jgi:transcriptional regulator with XRE-family HTH domain